MQESCGEAASLSTGMGNHSSMALQVTSSPRPCPAPSCCKKPQGKMLEGLQK